MLFVFYQVLLFSLKIGEKSEENTKSCIRDKVMPFYFMKATSEQNQKYQALWCFVQSCKVNQNPILFFSFVEILRKWCVGRLEFFIIFILTLRDFSLLLSNVSTIRAEIFTKDWIGSGPLFDTIFDLKYLVREHTIYVFVLCTN